MPQTPAWYPGKAEAAIDDDADTLEVLALDPNKAVILQTTVTCPSCGHRRDEHMPENECVYFYTCTNCKRVLKPIFGDCCVFCSYGTVICPTEQRRALDDASESIRRYVGDEMPGGLELEETAKAREAASAAPAGKADAKAEASRIDRTKTDHGKK
jgi:hypothetical protein